MAGNKVYSRSDLTEGDICMHCGKDLRKVKEIHAIEGIHFCSKKCAIDNHVTVIIASAKDTATQWYNDCAEVVTPTDIGIK